MKEAPKGWHNHPNGDGLVQDTAKAKLLEGTNGK